MSKLYVRKGFFFQDGWKEGLIVSHNSQLLGPNRIADIYAIEQDGTIIPTNEDNVTNLRNANLFNKIKGKHLIKKYFNRR